MNITVESDLACCKALWQKFSPNQTIWDLWEVAEAFYMPSIHTLHFLVINDDNKVVGVLPLLYESTTQRYMSFGGEYIEDIHFWFDVKYFRQVWRALPNKTFLYDVNPETYQEITQHYPELVPFCSDVTGHHFLNLDALNHDVPKFLATFSKKHRKNMLYDLNKVAERALATWKTDPVHFEKFVLFNQQRFGADSDFADPLFIESMRELLQVCATNGWLHTCVASIPDTLTTNQDTIPKQGVTVPLGVEYAVFYNNTYYVLNGGYDVSYKNLGKFLIYSHIQKACLLQAKRIDFLSGDDPWKHLWNLQRTEYFSLRKVIET